MTATGDYTKQVHLSAFPDRVFEILTTAAEFASWSAPATGSATEGGELRITFDGFEAPLVLRVKQATRPSKVIWDIKSCSFLPGPPALPQCQTSGVRRAFTRDQTG